MSLGSMSCYPVEDNYLYVEEVDEYDYDYCFGSSDVYSRPLLANVWATVVKTVIDSSVVDLVNVLCH